MPRYEALYASRRDSAAIRPERGPEPRDIAWPGMGVEAQARGRRGREEPEKSRSPAAAMTSGGCKPWLKIERDEARYEACMVLAEKIGEIDGPKKAFEILKEAVGTEDQEVFGLISLDTHLRLRGLAETGRGEIDGVMAPIGPTLRVAIQDGAQGILIWHVHPTLYTQPSESDIEVTKSFEAACKAVDLFFADHIIIGGWKNFYSFADHGYLK